MLAVHLQRHLRAAAGLLLAAVLVLAADILVLNGTSSGTHTLDVGSYRAGYFFSGIFEPEGSDPGQTYRWTSGQTTLRFRQARVAATALLIFELGGRPTPATVQLSFNGQPWAVLEATAEPRTYTLALPPAPTADITIGISSPTFTAGGDDTRQLGLKIARIHLITPSPEWRLPPAALVLIQVGLLAVLLLIFLRLGWPARACTAALALVALGLALLTGDLLSVYPYVWRLLGAAVALLVLTWLGLPLAMRLRHWAGGARELRLLWALMLLACALRLVGMLYPTFGGQDQFLHLKLLREVTEGQLIHAIVASEFGGGLALYPPATYLAMAPGRLLISDEVALLQGALALLDGFVALVVALMVRRLGGNRHAARMALLLYAGSLTAFTAMSYGFSAQLFGQCLVAPIALALMSGDPPLTRSGWLAAALLLLAAVASHVGVALLASVWVGLALLLMLARPHRHMLWGFGLLVACAIFAFVALYIDGIGIMLGNFGRVGSGGGSGWMPGATPLLWVGLQLAYSGVGLALLPCGFALIWRARRRQQAGVVALAWLLAVLIFFAIDLVFALQVRYFYFFLPLALAAIGIALGALAARSRWGYTVAWLTVLFISGQGVALWFGSAFASGKLSLTPLTH